MEIPKTWAKWIWGLIALIASVLVWIVPGTGDGGDSIQHFLTAKYAFQYPAFFFDLWAKPIYMFFAAPISQLGFRALMLGNVWLGLGSAWLIYRCAERCDLKASVWGIVFLFSVSGLVPLLYSGLTEPIFGFVLMLSVYFALGERLVLSVIIISFLPFVRNEGWAIVAVYLVFLSLRQEWRKLPLLTLGAIVTSLLGMPFQRQWNWIYTKIPDFGGQASYGEGSFFHFFNKLNYVIGIPLYGLLIIGGIALVYSIFRSAEREKIKHWFTFLWLVAGSYSAYFLAHSLAWWLPGLKSMGLERVLVGTIPLAILVALYGFQFLLSFLPSNWQKGTGLAIAAYVVVFPFTANPAAYNWEKDFQLSPDQVMIAEAEVFLSEKYAEAVWYHEHPYLNFLAQRNPFDAQAYHRILTVKDYSALASGTVIVWDSWFAVVEGLESLENLRNQPDLEEVRVIRHPDESIDVQVVVFVRK
ncbi:MAG: hypothetical protein AAF927_02105 [Bacteroidota bacterium]